jgi:ERCC4-type nuclease
MFIAPTEPPQLRALGVCTLMPEQYGVDIMWNSELGLIGIQRKVFPGDFLASVHDGRLNKEYQQMKALDVAILLLEGRDHWTTEGQLIRDRNGKRTSWSRTQHRNYLASVQLRGIQLATTESLPDTINYIGDMRVWTNKGEHHGLDIRPAAKGDGWGKVTNADYQRHLIQGLPGIGPKQAEALLQHLGMIFSLRVTEEELMEVPGIGRRRATAIRKVFEV